MTNTVTKQVDYAFRQLERGQECRWTLFRIAANVRTLERIRDAAEKLVRNLDAGTPHPIDMARLRNELDYPFRQLTTEENTNE